MSKDQSQFLMFNYSRNNTGSCGFLKAVFLFLFSMLLASYEARAGILRVSPDGNGTNPATWAGAHPTITAAIDSAQAGDQIWIRQGRYIESMTLKSGVALYGGFGGTESDTEFEQRNWSANDTILDGTALGQSLIYGTNVTAVTVDGFTVTSVDFYTTPPIRPDQWGGAISLTNSEVLVKNARILTNRLFSAPGSDGAGIACRHSALILQNSTFRNNWAYGIGSGLSIESSRAQIMGCTFEDNGGTLVGTLTSLAGALSVRDEGSEVKVCSCLFRNNAAAGAAGLSIHGHPESAPNVECKDCRFISNISLGTAFAFGGAISINYGSLKIQKCAFHDNGFGVFQAGSGGAVYVSITDDVLIEDCTFTENFANFGGAVYFYGSEGVIRRCLFERNLARQGGAAGFEPRGKVVDCVFRQNTANVVGGAVEVAQIGSTGDFSMERSLLTHNYSQRDGGALLCNISNATISNCVIASNTAERFGGGVLQHFGDYTRFINCTIVDNHCGELGGGVCRFQDEPFDFGVDWNNCILYGSAPDQIAGATSDNLRLSYSLVQGGWGGAGNIDADPLFQDPGGGDYRLQLASPCIDTASGSGPADDLLGSPRPVDIPGVGREGAGAFDMGAYEFQLAHIPTPTPTLTDTPIPTPTMNPGTDIDQSGKVDVEDLLILLRDWQKSASAGERGQGRIETE